MRRMIVLVAALALSACGTTTTERIGSAATAVAPVADQFLPAPETVANRTKIDEQAGLTVTLAYTAAAKGAALAIQHGPAKFREPATVKRIGAADRKAYAAVMAVRQAYLTANAASYATAVAQARAAVADLLRAFNGGG